MRPNLLSFWFSLAVYKLAVCVFSLFIYHNYRIYASDARHNISLFLLRVLYINCPPHAILYM